MIEKYQNKITKEVVEAFKVEKSDIKYLDDNNLRYPLGFKMGDYIVKKLGQEVFENYKEDEFFKKFQHFNY